MRAARLLALAALAACGDRASPPPRPDAAPRAARVKPPIDDVRVYPPYEIRSDGVGLYLIDAPLSEALRIVPEGPRVELLELDGALSWRVVRAEEGRLLIGADEESRVAFVVVLSADVARTEGGLTVGATAAAIAEKLGPPRAAVDVVRPRQVLEHARLPNVHFVSEAAAGAPPASARVSAVIVARPGLFGGPEPPPTAHAAACRKGGALAEVPAAELAAAGRPGKTRAGERAPAPRRVAFGCFSDDAPEALVVHDGEAVVVAGTPGKLRRVAAFPLAAGDHVAPLDADGDGRDELVTLGSSRDPERVVVQLAVSGLEAGRVVRVLAERPLTLSREALIAAGATPPVVELWPEAHREGDALVVGGLFAVRAPGATWRALAPLTPVRVRLEPRKPAGGAPGASGPPSTTAPAADAGPRAPVLPGIPDAAPSASGKSAPPPGAHDGGLGAAAKEPPP